MDSSKQNDDEVGEEADFFVAGSSYSESEPDIAFSQKYLISKQTPQFSRDLSPPLLLTFSGLSGQDMPASSSDPEEQQEDSDSDQPIEEWMILGGEEQQGDSSIQLNLGYWSSSSSEEDSGSEDETVKLVDDTWAVSAKDKWGADQPQLSCYYTPDRSLICHNCNRTGHLTKSCHIHKKSLTCVLCGMQGHIQRFCPGRHCPSCGLPSHGHRPCQEPPVWNQHCLRCGMTGHLSDACPDIWRQYHLTIHVEVPIRPQTDHNTKYVQRPAHCYNCSERGHYGYECTRRKMVSGTYSSLPYVCHYDTMEDIHHRCTRMQRRAKELLSFMHISEHQQLSEPRGESGEESQPTQGRKKRGQEAHSQAGRRKTWPERRRERREFKRLRREAQARREGGLLQGRSQGSSDDEACLTAPFRFPLHGHRQSSLPPQKRGKDGAGDRRSRKSREAERWKKRGGMKRGDLYPHDDLEVTDENLLSPKQRLRYRRR